jgi:pimeloyl-ACP methyl ester carboxylesterase
VNEAFNPIPVPGVSFAEHRVPVEDGVVLRVLEWIPEQPNETEPLFFVAGWISLVRGWRPLLEALVATRRVVYVETREKSSAMIDPDLLRVESFNIPRLAEDLVAVAKQFDLADGSAVLFGSSMGSNAILEALKEERLPARAAFLIGPNAEFRFPGWGRVAVRIIPPAVIERLKGFVIWYLRRFRVNEREDPEQMARYRRTVRSADPLRLKLAALAVLDYSALPGLETVSTPVAVAYAASDTLHGEDEVRRIVDAMPRGSAVVCPSNTYMHTADVLEDLEGFVGGLGESREKT